MASLEQRKGIYRVVLRLSGRRYSRSLRTRNRKAAIACVAGLEDNQRRVELGTLGIPDDCDPATFLLSDGRLISRPKQPTVTSLGQLLDEFIGGIPKRTECFTKQLAQGVTDDYKRKNKKTSRDYPRQKQPKAIGKPTIMVATKEQKKRLKQNQSQAIAA